MTRANHVRQMAKYNEWMNTKVFETAMRLTAAEITADKGAFFGSILGTLNHLAVGDTIWLKRFVNHPENFAVREVVQTLPAATSLDQQLHPDIQSLAIYRRKLDQIIIEWAAAIKDSDLDHVLQYTTTKGVAMKKNFYSVIMHFFNHQTHHRGQASTLLSQAGVDVGVTDLMALIPNEGDV